MPQCIFASGTILILYPLLGVAQAMDVIDNDEFSRNLRVEMSDALDTSGMATTHMEVKHLTPLPIRSLQPLESGSDSDGLPQYGDSGVSGTENNEVFFRSNSSNSERSVRRRRRSQWLASSPNWLQQMEAREKIPLSRKTAMPPSPLISRFTKLIESHPNLVREIGKLTISYGR